MVTGALPACRTDPSDSAGLRNHHDSIPKFGRLIVSRHTDFGPSSYLQPCSRQVHLASSFEHLVEKIDQVNLVRPALDRVPYPNPRPIASSCP